MQSMQSGVHFSVCRTGIVGHAPKHDSNFAHFYNGLMLKFPSDSSLTVKDTLPNVFKAEYQIEVTQPKYGVAAIFPLPFFWLRVYEDDHIMRCMDYLTLTSL